MDDLTKYLLALGGFRRAVRALTDAAAGLDVASQGHDHGTEVAEALFAECLTDLRRAAGASPGLRQLFATALETE